MPKDNLNDIDPVETEEWLNAMTSVIEQEGMERASYLLSRLNEKASRYGSIPTSSLTTPYRNTIPQGEEERMPGDLFMERRIRSIIRWNAMAMVMRANKKNPDLGGHISTFSSSATLYDVGFNYFFRAPGDRDNGDLVYFQGHSAPGIYARSFVEGRLTKKQLDGFRQEVEGDGLSSYPHPWLMPDYWQFPTVSMGLGPIQAIYQAHIMKYLSNRQLLDNAERKVWAFLGDGEMDEPESLGALSMAGRERLDNLIFVVNCNLQRLDGPVRGNGKVIHELEGLFRGAGWNVIKIIWGRHWDILFAKDKDGLLQRRMDEVVDGEYQNYAARNGAYIREHFFGKYPELLKMVEHLTDDDLENLNRGGHDPYKVYAGYKAAMNNMGKPTVILAKTVKGYAVDIAQAANNTHSVKKLELETLKKFRDRFNIPLADDQLESVPYYRPPKDSAEMQYMHKRREQLGGYLPQRRKDSKPLQIPSLDTFSAQLKGTGNRQASTTMAFVRLLSSLCKDKNIGQYIVPIVPDEARTFGMEGMFRQLGIYSSKGQLYDPADSNQVMYYREDIQGQMLEEGINEAGAMSAWIAAATSYSTNDYPLIPFYIYYSMFGYQRVGDLCWAAGDLQARGFLLGATAGRTTLNGEGLQHQDGHSHVNFGAIPNCITYDPTYAYEIAVVIQDGLRRMYQDNENIYYYITVMNENYQQPEIPDGVTEGIIKGMYLLEDSEQYPVKAAGKKAVPKVQLMGSGTILREVREAAIMLREDYHINVDVWSVPSFNECHRDGMAVARWNLLHPSTKPRKAYVTQCLEDRDGPVIAATDYIRNYADQIRSYIPQNYTVLGTDGFGRSDTREILRHFFEVDRQFVVIAALKALSDDGKIKASVVKEAIETFGIDPEKPDPMTC